jgi:uncharacterized protein (TIGR00297 family)
VSWRRWALAVCLGGAVSAAAYARRALTLDGALAATGVGAIVFARGGAPGAATLLAFFLSSSALSRTGESSKRSHMDKGARRDARQVLANGGAATLSIALGSRAGFVGGLAAAAADTWATEVGMLSKQPPRTITTWRQVERGMSGGVTTLGLLASIGGAATVGAAWAVVARERRALGVALVAGVFGSLLDSVLGATVQALYRCPACGGLTEQAAHARCGRAATRLVHGVRAIDNDRVNGLTTGSATLLGAWLGHRRRRR